MALGGWLSAACRVYDPGSGWFCRKLARSAECNLAPIELEKSPAVIPDRRSFDSFAEANSLRMTMLKEISTNGLDTRLVRSVSALNYCAELILWTSRTGD